MAVLTLTYETKLGATARNHLHTTGPSPVLRRAPQPARKPVNTGTFRLSRCQPVVASASGADVSSTSQPSSRQQAEEARPLEHDEHSAAEVGAQGSDQAEQLSEKEKLRRQRISEANAGKMAWNKGRKHSPETIEKIRQRTKIAMQRPDVLQKVRENHLPQKHSEETRAKITAKLRAHYDAKKIAKAIAEGRDPYAPPEPKPEKPKSRKAGSAAPSSSTSDEEAPSDTESPAEAADTQAAPKSTRKSRKTSETESAKADLPTLPAAPTEKRQRKPPSEEHRRAISEAIKRKWAEPEYRARALKGMEDYVEQKFGKPPGTSRRRRSTSSTAAAAARQHQEVTARAKQVVQKILKLELLVVGMENQILVSKSKMEAFVNNPMMAEKQLAALEKAEENLDQARTMLSSFVAQLPPGTRYDRDGTVYVPDPTTAVQQQQSDMVTSSKRSPASQQRPSTSTSDAPHTTASPRTPSSSSSSSSSSNNGTSASGMSAAGHLNGRMSASSSAYMGAAAEGTILGQPGIAHVNGVHVNGHATPGGLNGTSHAGHAPDHIWVVPPPAVQDMVTGASNGYQGHANGTSSSSLPSSPSNGTASTSYANERENGAHLANNGSSRNGYLGAGNRTSSGSVPGNGAEHNLNGTLGASEHQQGPATSSSSTASSTTNGNGNCNGNEGDSGNVPSTRLRRSGGGVLRNGLKPKRRAPPSKGSLVDGDAVVDGGGEDEV